MVEEENCNSQATEEWLNQEEVISGVQWSKVDLVGLYFIFWNDFNTNSTKIPGSSNPVQTLYLDAP